MFVHWTSANRHRLINRGCWTPLATLCSCSNAKRQKGVAAAQVSAALCTKGGTPYAAAGGRPLPALPPVGADGVTGDEGGPPLPGFYSASVASCWSSCPPLRCLHLACPVVHQIVDSLGCLRSSWALCGPSQPLLTLSKHPGAATAGRGVHGIRGTWEVDSMGKPWAVWMTGPEDMLDERTPEGEH